MDGQAADKVEHAQMILCLFAPASQDTARAFEPSVRAFDHPAPGSILAFFVGLGFFAPQTDVGHETAGLETSLLAQPLSRQTCCGRALMDLGLATGTLRKVSASSSESLRLALVTTGRVRPKMRT